MIENSLFTAHLANFHDLEDDCCCSLFSTESSNLPAAALPVLGMPGKLLKGLLPSPEAAGMLGKLLKPAFAAPPPAVVPVAVVLPAAAGLATPGCAPAGGVIQTRSNNQHIPTDVTAMDKISGRLSPSSYAAAAIMPHDNVAANNSCPASVVQSRAMLRFPFHNSITLQDGTAAGWYAARGGTGLK